MSYRIIENNGHYDVYIEGEFFCSADTMAEAVHEVKSGYSY